MKLTPSADRVIIEPDSESEMKSPGGIVIPQTAYQEYRRGTVVAVGPGPSGEMGTCAMTSKVGDKVIYPPSLGRIVPVRLEDGSEKEYLVIRQHEITITISEDAPAPDSHSVPTPKTRGRKKS